MQGLCNNPIVDQLQTIVNFLSAGVGVVVVVMIVWGGIKYASAGDNPQAVADAKNHITNALLALLLFMLMFAFLQWLIPGGIFRTGACRATTAPNHPFSAVDWRVSQVGQSRLWVV
jgi:hypothetical protein